MGAPFIGRGAVDLGHSGAVNIMEIRVGKIVGRVSGRRWAQVHDYSGRGGRLVAAVSLELPEEKSEMEVVAIGREVLARIHELYFGGEEKQPMELIREAVEKVREEFGGGELAAVVVVGEAVYVAASGAGVWCRVGDKEGWVVEPNAQRSTLNAQSFSGWVRDGEILVLGNSRFWEEVPMGTIRAAVQNPDLEGAVETLGAVLQGGDKGEGGVGVVVRMHDNKSEILNSKSQISSDIQIQKSKIAFKLPEIKLPKLKWPKIGWPKAVYVVHGDRRAEKKRTMWVGVGFLAVLLVLVGGWRWSERNKAIKQSFQNRQIEEIVYKFNEAKVLLVLNPIRSRELLKEVEPEAQRFKGTKKIDQRLAAIFGEWEGVWNEAMGTKVVEPELVVDLGLVREGMTGAKLEIRDGKLVVLDTQGDRLIEVNPEKKSVEVVAGKDDLGDAKLLATYPGKTVVLSDKGIVEFPNPGVVVKPDDGWGEVVDMGMFAGNIYLLSKGQIWRHQVTDAGYGGRQEWIGPEDHQPLAEASNMAIDGSVWISGGGNILKYTRGIKDSFAISGLDNRIGEGAVIYTDEDTLKLYVLDPTTGSGRVVVLAKTGEYEGQYTAEQLGEGKDLAVDEKMGKIYVTSGSKIWAIKI